MIYFLNILLILLTISFSYAKEIEIQNYDEDNNIVYVKIQGHGGTCDVQVKNHKVLLTNCLELTNSKHIEILCSRNKAICKTKDEVYKSIEQDFIDMRKAMEALCESETKQTQKNQFNSIGMSMLYQPDRNPKVLLGKAEDITTNCTIDIENNKITFTDCIKTLNDSENKILCTRNKYICKEEKEIINFFSYNLKQYLIDEEKEKEEGKKEFNLKHRRCLKGDSEACTYLGKSYIYAFRLSYSFTPDDIGNMDKAFFYLKKGCDGNDYNACTVLGELFNGDYGDLEGYKVQIDKDLSIKFYMKSCNLKYSEETCNYARTSFQENNEIKNNISEDIINIKDILIDYTNNEIYADNKYKGKHIKFRGIIDSISKDIMDNPYMIISTGKLFQVPMVQAFFDKSNNEQLSKFNRDSIISLDCKVNGLIINNIIMDDCKILE